MHRLFPLKSEGFAHQNNVNAVLHALLRRNKITATDAAGAVTTVGHTAFDPHADTGVPARKLQTGGRI